MGREGKADAGKEGAINRAQRIMLTLLRVEASLVSKTFLQCCFMTRFAVLDSPLLHLLSGVHGIKSGMMQIIRCLREEVEATDEVTCWGGHEV